jgi:hypothetical protein
LMSRNLPGRTGRCPNGRGQPSKPPVLSPRRSRPFARLAPWWPEALTAYRYYASRCLVELIRGTRSQVCDTRAHSARANRGNPHCGRRCAPSIFFLALLSERQKRQREPPALLSERHPPRAVRARSAARGSGYPVNTPASGLYRAVARLWRVVTPKRHGRRYAGSRGLERSGPPERVGRRQRLRPSPFPAEPEPPTRSAPFGAKHER